MDKLDRKLYYLRYEIYKLIEWFIETNYLDKGYDWKSHFSHAKICKLNMYITSATIGEDKRGLLDIFNKHYILSLKGTVEKDLMYHGKELCLDIINSNKDIEDISNLLISEFDQNDENIIMINEGIGKLRQLNPNLVLYNFIELCELNQIWYSYRSKIHPMRTTNTFKMSDGVFMLEPKHYILRDAEDRINHDIDEFFKNDDNNKITHKIKLYKLLSEYFMLNI